MTFELRLLVLLTALAASSPAAAQAPPSAQPAPSGPVYVVTYFDVAPAASRKTGAMLRQFTAASRREPGNLDFLALREIGRPGRFAVVEAWQDKGGLDAHGAAMAAVGDKLQPVLLTPFDARRFTAFAVAAPGRAADNDAIYVLTHVDVFPAGKDQAATLVKQLVEDSRKDASSVRFDAVVWEGHPNHFHLIEAWAGRAAREAHALALHMRQFRGEVAPLEGAFYDERLYEPVR